MNYIFRKSNELFIPEKARNTKNSSELIRVWTTPESDIHVAIRTGVWSDPAAYGIVLADLVKHIARGFHQTNGMDEKVAAARIIEGFAAEINSPTDIPSGNIEK